MPERVIESDYLIVGAGAVGMTFADVLLEETKATVVLVDRRHRPGGHWNDSYPFVRLHQPARLYGVNSFPLGSGAKDEVGLNRGFYELASGQEVLSHFDLVMQQRFLPSGRVQFLPMSEASDDGTVTSLLSGEQTMVKARKLVDASFSSMQIPATHPPRYEVADGVTCVPPNDLPRIAGTPEGYVVVGAGKTGMDTCLWLLANGAEPASIRWIMPRDYWLLNRECFQPGEEFLARGMRSLADQVEAVAESETVDEVFERLEAAGEILRLNPEVTPRGYHCAIVSQQEMEQLRRIKNVVRMGHVKRIGGDEIEMEGGSVPTTERTVHIDCSAAGIPPGPSRPIFEGRRITPQWVRLCQPTFSAAMVGHVEATYDDDADKNRLCPPISPPSEPVDWLRMLTVELGNRRTWSAEPGLVEWVANSRLDPFTARMRSLTGTETEAIPHVMRYQQYVGAAVKKLPVLLGA